MKTLEKNIPDKSITKNNSVFFQPKLTINQPNDVYEQEADAVAEQVMRMSVSKNENSFFKPVSINSIQRKCDECEDEEKLQEKEDGEEPSIQLKPAQEFDIQRKCSAYDSKEKLFRKEDDDDDDEQVQLKPMQDFDLQRKCACEEEENLIHRKESQHNNTPSITPSVLQTLSSSGQPMDRSTRSFMEQRFGYDFRNVQIHNDLLAHKSSADINALAYTHDNHVVFSAGQYQPDNQGGKQLLAHELTHVLQQTKGLNLQSSSTMIGPVTSVNKIQRNIYPGCEQEIEENDPEAERINNIEYDDSNCKDSSPTYEEYIPPENPSPLFNQKPSCCELFVQSESDQIEQNPAGEKAEPPCKVVEDIEKKQDEHLKAPVEKPNIHFFPKEPKKPENNDPENSIAQVTDQFSEANIPENIPSPDNTLIPLAQSGDLVALSKTLLNRKNELSAETGSQDKKVFNKITASFIDDATEKMNDLVVEGIRLQNFIEIRSGIEKKNIENFINMEYQGAEKFFDQIIKSAKSQKQSVKSNLGRMFTKTSNKMFWDSIEAEKPINDIQTEDSENIDKDLTVNLKELKTEYDSTSSIMEILGKNAGSKAPKRAIKWHTVYTSGSGWGPTVKDKIDGKTTDGKIEGVELTKRKFKARADSTDKVGTEFKWGIINKADEAARKIYCSHPDQEKEMSTSHIDTKKNLSCLERLAQINIHTSMWQYDHVANILKAQSMLAVENSWKETDHRLRVIKKQQLDLLIDTREKMLAKIDRNSEQLKADLSLGITGGVNILLENLDVVAGWHSNNTIPDREDQEEIIKSFYTGIQSGRSDILKILNSFNKGLQANTSVFSKLILAKILYSKKASVVISEKFSKYSGNIEKHSELVFEYLSSAAKKEFNNYKDIYETPMRKLRPGLSSQIKVSIAKLKEKFCDLLINMETGFQKVFVQKGAFDKTMICAAQKAADTEVPAYRRGLEYLKYVIIGAIIGITIVLTGGLAAIAAAGFLGIGTIVLGMAIIGAVSSALISTVQNIADGKPIGDGVLKEAGLGAITGLFGGIGSFIFKGGTIASIIGSMGFDIGSGIVADLIFRNEISLEGMLLGAAIGLGVGLAFTRVSKYFPRSQKLDDLFKRIENRLNRGGKGANPWGNTGSGMTDEGDSKRASKIGTTVAEPEVSSGKSFEEENLKNDLTDQQGRKPTRESLEGLDDDMVKLKNKANNPKNIKEVGDPAFMDKYDAKVKVGRHRFMRDKVTGRWCRFSKNEVCNIVIPAELNSKVDGKLSKNKRTTIAKQQRGHKRKESGRKGRRLRPPQMSDRVNGYKTVEDIFSDLSKELNLKGSQRVPKKEWRGKWSKVRRKVYRYIFGSDSLPVNIKEIEISIHHIQEKYAGGKHSIDNLLPILHKVHTKISAIYNLNILGKKMRIRDLIKTLPAEAQRGLGYKILFDNIDSKDEKALSNLMKKLDMKTFR